MSPRIAVTDLHIPADAGVRIVGAGEAIPEDLYENVSNPDAFLEVDEDEGLADKAAEAAKAKAAADAAEKAKQIEAQKAADALAAQAAADQAKAEETRKLVEGGTELNTPAGSDLEAKAYDPSAEPEHGTPLAERAYNSLQKAAKLRGLNASGNQEVLLARLEADDRERADEE